MFTIRKIRNKTIGEILQETRQEQNLSMEEVSEKTHIHINYLTSLETEDYSKLPKGVYLEKILETYANFLNIDFDCLKKLLAKETVFVSRTSNKTFIPRISPRKFIVTTRLIKIFLAVFGIIILLTYLGFEISNIFSPPALDIFTPMDNLSTDKSNVEVSGQTEQEVKIKINDQEIQIDKSGYFKESVSLKIGLNVIKISAAKKRSKENIVYRRVIFNPQNP